MQGACLRNVLCEESTKLNFSYLKQVILEAMHLCNISPGKADTCPFQVSKLEYNNKFVLHTSKYNYNILKIFSKTLNNVGVSVRTKGVSYAVQLYPQ